MSQPTYDVQCDCESVQLRLSGEPRVRGYCHCEDCRELLKIPYHSVTAWLEDQVEIVAGETELTWYQHPTKRMQRVYCSRCGETMFNTNGMGWRVVSQLLIRKNLGGELPPELSSLSHFFHDRRIVDIVDDLPRRP